jgi:hypothetical protein
MHRIPAILVFASLQTRRESGETFARLCFCGAKSSSSLNRIRDAMAATKKELGVAEQYDWLNGHYQYCNRLVALDLLNRNGSSARLAYVYFYGDLGDKRRTCPASQAIWEKAVSDRDAHVGLSPGHRLEKRVHHVFIDARIRASEAAERGAPLPHHAESGK